MARSKEGGMPSSMTHELEKEAVTFMGNLMRVGRLAEEEWTETFLLRDIRIKQGRTEAAGWFAVVRVTIEDAPFVAFVTGGTLEDTVRLVCNSLLNGSLKWKEDKYAQ